MTLDQDEEGLFSAIALAVLAILMVLGLSLFFLSQRRYSTTQRFVLETRLEYAAESGVLAGTAVLEDDPQRAEALGAAASCIFQQQVEEEDIECTVYAMRMMDRVTVFAVSRHGEETGRRAGCLKKKEKTYVFDHWEP